MYRVFHMKHQFMIEVDVHGPTPAEVRDYVKSALESWGGALAPADPFASLRGKVMVKRVRPKERIGCGPR